MDPTTPQDGTPARHIWVDGKVGTEHDLRISAFDHALLTGDGVFETLKVVQARAFAVTRHLERIRRSAEPMGLSVRADGELRDAIEAVIDLNGIETGRIRITLTGGPAPLGSGRGGPPTTIVAGEPMEPWPSSTPVVTVPWPRNERGATAGIKTVSYAENVIALRYAHARGAGEAIFANTQGDLCEGTGSNVFVAVDGQLRTPPLESGCLAGITRELLVECGVVVEQRMPLDVLQESTEVFLTSSTRDVQPVSSVDSRDLDCCPGPRTQEAMDAFKGIVARTIDP